MVFLFVQFYWCNLDIQECQRMIPLSCSRVIITHEPDSFSAVGTGRLQNTTVCHNS